MKSFFVGVLSGVAFTMFVVVNTSGWRDKRIAQKAVADKAEEINRGIKQAYRLGFEAGQIIHTEDGLMPDSMTNMIIQFYIHP